VNFSFSKSLIYVSIPTLTSFISLFFLHPHCLFLSSRLLSLSVFPYFPSLQISLFPLFFLTFLSLPFPPLFIRYDIATFLLGHPPLFNFPALEEFISLEKKKKNNAYLQTIKQDGKHGTHEEREISKNRSTNIESAGGDISNGGRDSVEKHPTRDSAFSLPLSDPAEESDRFQDCKHFLALSRGGAFFQ
jgi:hypothetical protein